MGDPDNGGYMNYGDDGESDFKRKADSKKDITLSDDEDAGRSGKPSEYFIKELLAERVQLQMEGKYPHSDRLLQQGELNMVILIPESFYPSTPLFRGQKSPTQSRTTNTRPGTCDMWISTMRSQSRLRLRC